MTELKIWGCDTETYVKNDEYGLISIQIHGDDDQRYFTSSDFSQKESAIRSEICQQFFGWLNKLRGQNLIAFFNIDFDASQFMRCLIHESPWQYVYGVQRPEPGYFTVLESDITLYMIRIHTRTATIEMLDLAHFLTATTLDKACEQWIGERKLELETKRFPKAPATEEQRRYAMHDAEITQHLAVQLQKSEVLEGTKYVTVAGRTLGHFRIFLHKEYGMSFEEFTYGTKDKELIEIWKARIEEVWRPYTRGGICRAFQTDLFEDCHHVDARSMYPSQMVRDYIPHGPLLDVPPDTGRYATIYFPIGIFVLKPDKISGLQFRSKAQCYQYAYQQVYEPAEYVADVFFDGSFPMWDEEYAVFRECFEPVGEIDDSKRLYVEMIHNTILKRYIQALYKGKNENEGTVKYFYKILMNSLYGKFLSRPDGVAMSYEGGERHEVEETERPTYYLILGNWIAMMGRVTLMKCLLSIPKGNLLYCDTDSCIYFGDKHPDVEIGKQLGQWGIENDHFRAWIVGPKTYQEENSDGSVITKCAGLSNDVRADIPFATLEEGGVYLVHKGCRNPDTWAIEIRPTVFQVSCKAKPFRQMLL